MHTNELKRIFSHRLSKFDHLLRLHSSDIEDTQKQQIVGAMKEISVMLKTIEND